MCSTLRFERTDLAVTAATLQPLFSTGVNTAKLACWSSAHLRRSI
jgi:hypothetical protein